MVGRDLKKGDRVTVLPGTWDPEKTGGPGATIWSGYHDIEGAGANGTSGCYDIRLDGYDYGDEHNHHFASIKILTEEPPDEEIQEAIDSIMKALGGSHG